MKPAETQPRRGAMLASTRIAAPRGRRAFTLIELLVVISIIAILAGILFPVFAKARDKAKQSRSLSNMRQIAMAEQQYETDYDDHLPGWQTDTTGATLIHNVWDEQIDPYIKDAEVYSNGDKGIASPSQPRPWTRTLTYVLNAALISPWTMGDVDFTQRTSTPSIRFKNPSGTILFAEVATSAGYVPAAAPAADAFHATGTGATSNGYSAAVGGNTATGGPIDASPKTWVEVGQGAAAYSETTWTAGNPPANKYGIARDLYGGSGCYAFLDGHVKSLKIDQTVTGGQTINGGPSANWDPSQPSIQFNMWYPG